MGIFVVPVLAVIARLALKVLAAAGEAAAMLTAQEVPAAKLAPWHKLALIEN